MDASIVPYYPKTYLLEDRMLFVRTSDIYETMKATPILVASLIIVVIMPIQPSFGSIRSLDLIIYPDGSTHISREIQVDPLITDYKLDLFGDTVDNFVVTGEDGHLLDSELIGNTAFIETFGSSSINVQYDIHDLVSKQGRVWTFSLNTDSEFTVLLPKNSAIVGMTNLPLNMELIDDHNQLTLPGGSTEIDYLFSNNPSTNTNPPESTNPGITNDDSQIYIIFITGIAVAIGLAVVTRILRQKQNKNSQITSKATNQIEKRDIIVETDQIDINTIFKLRPTMRDDDKEIVKFISNNGGQAFESDLRKKFLQPRTTMWRAVKRLERSGVIEIEKKDLQNLVKIRKNIEEEEKE